MKAIPLNKIEIVSQDLQLREKLNKEQIRELANLYGAGVKVDPIEVLLIQTGDPSQNRFLILDGHHRYEALKSLNLVKKNQLIEANIDTALSVTEDTFDTPAVKNYIQLRQAFFNCKHGCKPTPSERKTTAIALAARGVSLDKIADTRLASRTQIHRWTAVIAKTMKLADNERVNLLLKEGGSTRKVAEKSDRSRATVLRIAKKATSDDSSSSLPASRHIDGAEGGIKCPNGTFDTSNPADEKEDLSTQSAPSHSGEPSTPQPLLRIVEGPPKFIMPDFIKTLKNLANHQKIEIIYETINSLPQTQQVEDDVLVTIVGLLSAKFRSIDQKLKGESVIHTHQLQQELQATRETAAAFSSQAKEFKNEGDKKEEELNSRKHFCKFSCQYTKDRLQHEAKKTVHGLYSQLLKYSGSGQDNRRAKTVPELQLLFNKLKEEGHHDAVAQFTRQTIIDWSFSITSYLEWAFDVGILTDDLRVYLDKVELLLSSSKIRVKDLNSRISAIRNNTVHFSKDPQDPSLIDRRATC